jgi:hypothetical protein
LSESYCFIVPPGDAASPFFAADPAVLAPCVLASLPDGFELLAELPVALFFESSVVALFAAGLPACARARLLERAKAVAKAMVLIFMVVSSVMPLIENAATENWFQLMAAAFAASPDDG